MIYNQLLSPHGLASLKVKRSIATVKGTPLIFVGHVTNFMSLKEIVFFLFLEERDHEEVECAGKRHRPSL